MLQVNERKERIVIGSSAALVGLAAVLHFTSNVQLLNFLAIAKVAGVAAQDKISALQGMAVAPDLSKHASSQSGAAEFPDRELVRNRYGHIPRHGGSTRPISRQ